METLKKFLETQKESNDSKDSGAGKWVWGVVLSILVAALLGGYYFLAWRKGKKLAKLLHEKDQLEQDKIVDEIMKTVEGNEAEGAAYSRRIAELALGIDELARKIAQTEKEHEDAKRTIESIRSWDDADKYRSDRFGPDSTGRP